MMTNPAIPPVAPKKKKEPWWPFPVALVLVTAAVALIHYLGFRGGYRQKAYEDRMAAYAARIAQLDAETKGLDVEIGALTNGITLLPGQSITNFIFRVPFLPSPPAPPAMDPRDTLL